MAGNTDISGKSVKCMPNVMPIVKTEAKFFGKTSEIMDVLSPGRLPRSFSDIVLQDTKAF